jgi:hypothetical protein
MSANIASIGRHLGRRRAAGLETDALRALRIQVRLRQRLPEQFTLVWVAGVEHHQPHHLFGMQARVDAVEQSAHRMADEHDRSGDARRVQQRMQPVRIALAVEGLGVGVAPAHAGAVVGDHRILRRQRLPQAAVGRRGAAAAGLDDQRGLQRAGGRGTAALQVHGQPADVVQLAGCVQLPRPVRLRRAALRLFHTRPVVEVAHAVRQVGEVGAQRGRRRHVQHRLGDGAELGMEVLRRLHDDQLLGREVDAQAREEVGAR